MPQTLKKTFRFCVFCIIYLTVFFLCSCTAGKPVAALKKQDLFSLNYGNFENELKLFGLQESGQINTHLIMRDGFFYISNGEASKILSLTSYGDLLSILYNSDKNPVPSFIELNGNKTVSALDHNDEIATQNAVVYPFNNIGAAAVDSGKRLYVADLLPPERCVQDESGKTTLRHAVLRFEPDGSFIDYLGQEGPGGTPFPYIKGLYTTKQNELVVVCLLNGGYAVFWFSRDGYLKYKIPIQQTSLPVAASSSENSFATLEQIIPDYSEPVLYLKIDYYSAQIDSSTGVQSGIAFTQTLIHPLNISTGIYAEPVSVPDFEQTVAYGYTKEVFPMAYEFLGISESGWLFFITADDTGFALLMFKEDGQKAVRRHLDVDMRDIVYHDLTLSYSGIISALLAKNDKAEVVWWRTDTLIAALIQ